MFEIFRLVVHVQLAVLACSQSYSIVDSGSCASNGYAPIESKAECESAAAALSSAGVTDFTAFDICSSSYGETCSPGADAQTCYTHPSGCTVRAYDLGFLRWVPCTTAFSCGDSQMSCLCKDVNAPSFPTATPTPAPTSAPTPSPTCAVQNGGCVAPHSRCVESGSHLTPYCIDPDRVWAYPASAERSTNATLFIRLAVVLVNARGQFTNASSEQSYGRYSQYTAQMLGAAIFEDEWGVASFYTEMSGGRVAVEGLVVDWIDDFSAGGLTADQVGERQESYWGAAFSAFDPAVIDIFVLAGVASSGRDQRGVLWTSNSVSDGSTRYQNVGIVYLINTDFFVTAGEWRFDGWLLPSVPWAHEIFHSIGIMAHSNSLYCFSSPPTQDLLDDSSSWVEAAMETISSTCQVKAYGDPFSHMGERLWATHPTTASKVRLGWLDADQLAVLPANRSHVSARLHAHAASTQGDGKAAAVRVVLEPPLVVTNGQGATWHFDRLYVEYRAPVGFDRYLSGLGSGPRRFSNLAYRYLNVEADAPWDFALSENIFTKTPEFSPVGVLLYLEESTSCCAAYLLDARPELTEVVKMDVSPKGHEGNAGKFASAMVPANTTLHLPLMNVEVRVDAVGAARQRRLSDSTSEFPPWLDISIRRLNSTVLPSPTPSAAPTDSDAAGCLSHCPSECVYTCQQHNPRTNLCVGARSNHCDCVAPPWC